jgi:hypothetical protein
LASPLPSLTFFLFLSETTPARILYCRCAFAQAVPVATKDAVLAGLCESGASFECVSDLCEMSARKDEALGEMIAGDAPVRIVACYPRAVKWLFHHAGAPFPEGGRIEVLNMRELGAEEISQRLLEEK